MKVTRIFLFLFLIPIVVADSEDCYNKMQNFGELGIDCGGPCDLKCSTCNDGIKNQGETEIDCGGICDACKKTRLSFTTFTIILSTVLVTLVILYLTKKNTEKNLKKYVETLRSQGYASNFIRDLLRKEGWTDKEIEKTHKER